MELKLSTFDADILYDNLLLARQRAGEECGNGKDSRGCVYYCFVSSEKKSVNLKERERLRISIGSLNSAIDVILLTDIPEFFGSSFEGAKVKKVSTPKRDSTNWQYIARWEHLCMLCNYDRVLYVDSDTLWNDDPQILFDKYNTANIYGREELGFPMDTNAGAYGKRGRYLLDMVDAGIVSEWHNPKQGTIPPKYCMGVMLFNKKSHLYVYSRYEYLKECIEKCKNGQQFYPLPNLRIIDEYAMWCLLGQLNNFTYDYFTPQDVSMPYGEKKHADYYNPVLLHYTTNKEKEAVDNMPELETLKEFYEKPEE